MESVLLVQHELIHPSNHQMRVELILRFTAEEMETHRCGSTGPERFCPIPKPPLLTALLYPSQQKVPEGRMCLPNRKPRETQSYTGCKQSKKGLTERVPSNLALERRWEDISLEERPDTGARKQGLLSPLGPSCQHHPRQTARRWWRAVCSN